MKLLIDAQLPQRLADALIAREHDVVHTSELPDGNRTTDAEIARIADRDNRVVVTKDRDFLDGHLLRSTPRRLLVVSTGNICNDDLIALVTSVEPVIIEALDRSDLVELSRHAVTSH